MCGDQLPLGRGPLHEADLRRRRLRRVCVPAGPAVRVRRGRSSPPRLPGRPQSRRLRRSPPTLGPRALGCAPSSEPKRKRADGASLRSVGGAAPRGTPPLPARARPVAGRGADAPSTRRARSASSRAADAPELEPGARSSFGVGACCRSCPSRWWWPRCWPSWWGRRSSPTDRCRLSALQHDLTLEQSAHRQSELAVAGLETPSRIVATALADQMVRPANVTELPYVSLSVPLPTPQVTPAPAPAPAPTTGTGTGTGTGAGHGDRRRRTATGTGDVGNR